MNSTMPARVVKELRRAYDSAVSWTDSLIGRVIDELDSIRLANNTIVSFWCDHGWQLGEHSEWSKHTNFEIAKHAPMMVHIPGLTDVGVTTDELVEFVDLLPTLVEAAGLHELALCPEDSFHISLCREGVSSIPLMQNSNNILKNTSDIASWATRYELTSIDTQCGYIRPKSRETIQGLNDSKIHVLFQRAPMYIPV